jgi:hypothetical protein
MPLSGVYDCGNSAALTVLRLSLGNDRHEGIVGNQDAGGNDDQINLKQMILLRKNMSGAMVIASVYILKPRLRYRLFASLQSLAAL